MSLLENTSLGQSSAITLVGKDGATLAQNRSAGLLLGRSVGRA